jgi:hypothetical protein
MFSLIARLQKRLLLNSSRIYLERHNQSFAQIMKTGARMLDPGAGDAPYKVLFRSFSVTYESADFEQVDKPYAKSPTNVISARTSQSKMGDLIISFSIRRWNIFGSRRKLCLSSFEC